METKIMKLPKLMSNPTDPKHPVTKEYVDLMANKKIKDAVVAVQCSNIDGTYADKVLTQTTPAELIADGVTLAEGDRVLLAGQTDATQNGIYVVTTLGVTGTTAAVLTRAEDFDDTSKIVLNVRIPVQQGDQNADKTWQLTNDTAVTLDTTALTFAKADDGAGSGTGKFTAAVTGNGTDKFLTVTHGLNTEAVVVSAVDTATKADCIFGLEIVSANVVKLHADMVLATTDSYTVTVIG